MTIFLSEARTEDGPVARRPVPAKTQPSPDLQRQALAPLASVHSPL